MTPYSKENGGPLKQKQAKGALHVIEITVNQGQVTTMFCSYCLSLASCDFYYLL